MHANIALVDLSYLFKKAWHAAPRDAAPGHAAQATLDQLAGVRSRTDHVIVCCDSPPYRRKAIDQNYKAQREKPTDEEVSQKKWLMDRIEKDGYQIARAPGYEADDVIATLATKYQEMGCEDVRIVANDKDAAQLVTDTCVMHVPSVGDRPPEIRGRAEIYAKYGVYPSDMGLWLALVGDTSDNIPGVPGVGPKKAAELIANCKNMVGIAEALADSSTDAKRGKMWDSIATHWEQLQSSLKLTVLEYDAPLDVEALLLPKQAAKLVEDEMGDAADQVLEAAEGEFDEEPESRPAPNPTVAAAPVVAPGATAAPTSAQPNQPSAAGSSPATAIVKHESKVTEDLQPLDIDSAYRLAKAFTNGRLYSKFHSPEAIFTIIVKARELGLKVTAALDGFHIIEGRPSASADMIRALAERHPDCEYFMMVESSAESATWETKNRRHPAPTRYTYSIAEARQAGLNGGNWSKRPRDMLTKTAASKLARIAYPGATVGLYCPEELEG